MNGSWGELTLVILYNKSNPTVSLSDQSKSLPKGTLKKAKYD